MGSTTYLLATIRWRVWLLYRVVSRKLRMNVSLETVVSSPLLAACVDGGLAAGQTDAEFDAMLDGTIEGIYQASRSWSSTAIASDGSLFRQQLWGEERRLRWHEITPSAVLTISSKGTGRMRIPAMQLDVTASTTLRTPCW